MTTLGSVSREEAAERFPFLAARYPGRRAAIKEFTHAAPDFVCWSGALVGSDNGDLYGTLAGLEARDRSDAEKEG